MTEAAEKVEFVSFRVDGDFLADFARARLEEGAWDRALSLLTDSLEGLTTDQAISILKGEATLTGDSSKGIDIKSLPKNGKLAKKMQDRMDYMYGSIFRLGDKLWKPYALVSGWDKEDWHFAQSFRGANFLGFRDDKYRAGARSMFYANNPAADMLLRVAERWVGDYVLADVLCERVLDTPPFWYKISAKDPILFVEELLKHKTLPIRGAMQNRAWDEHSKYAKQDLEPEEVEVLDSAEHIEEQTDKIAPTTLLVDKGEDAMNDLAAKELVAEILTLAENYLVTTPTDYAELREMDRIFEKGVDTLHRQITSDQWDKIDELRLKFDTEKERILGENVRAQADLHGGYIELPLEFDGKPYKQPTLKVPKNPFLHWCLRFLDFEAHGHETPVWKLVAGSGHKMSNDDPYHTDWMLGAGVSLKETYNHDEGSFGDVIRKSSFGLKDKIVKEYTGHEFSVLAKGDQLYISGEVVLPKPNERVPTGSIAIVPHAGPEYQNAMETANMESPDGRRGCIIAETGGKLAHLVVVGREFNCTVLMMPGAVSRYKAGDRVMINVQDGTIENLIY